MDENAKTEQDLSEKLLQQITGGCANCLRDIVGVIDRHDQIAANEDLRRLSENTGRPAAAERYRQQNLALPNEAGNLLQRVQVRQSTPGHQIATEWPADLHLPNGRSLGGL